MNAVHLQEEKERLDQKNICAPTVIVPRHLFATAAATSSPFRSVCLLHFADTAFYARTAPLHSRLILLCHIRL